MASWFAPSPSYTVGASLIMLPCTLLLVGIRTRGCSAVLATLTLTSYFAAGIITGAGTPIPWIQSDYGKSLAELAIPSILNSSIIVLAVTEWRRVVSPVTPPHTR